MALLSVAIALILGGCAPPSAGYGSSSPGRYPGYDPYHYRCSGNCQAGG
jgi:hypothetical protein